MNMHHISHLCPAEYYPSPHHLPPWTVLQNRYTVGHVLGEGGFGITYLGFDLHLEMPVAIKEYFPVSRCTRHAGAGSRVVPLHGLPEKHFYRGMQKYLREARILARFEKLPVIVNVRDYFEENNTAYIVMEYIDGPTLAQLIGGPHGGACDGEGEEGAAKLRRTPFSCMPARDFFSLLEPLFPAMTAIHEAGVLHRDICPENLMLENGKIRLVDFGCAREARSLRETRTITLHHGYAPIEQYQLSGGQGPWTDIYSLCATIYSCLTGVTPTLATDRITRDTLCPPRSLGADMTARQELAVMKGLHVRPHQRYRTMAALYAALYTG